MLQTPWEERGIIRAVVLIRAAKDVAGGGNSDIPAHYLKSSAPSFSSEIMSAGNSGTIFLPGAFIVPGELTVRPQCNQLFSVCADSRDAVTRYLQ